MTDTERYAAAWRGQRWLRRALLSWVVLLFGFLLLFDRIWPPPLSAGDKAVFLGTLVVWAVVQVGLVTAALRFRCPGCGGFFNLARTMRAYIKRSGSGCIHCGLPVGAGPHRTIPD